MPDLMPNIRRALNDYTSVKARILAEYPEEDEHTLQDTISGETYLDDAIAVVLREAEATKAEAETGLQELINALTCRKERKLARACRLKDLALWAAQEAGLKKIGAPDFTASIVTPEHGRVIITDEKALPRQYIKTVSTETPMKKEITAALANGADIPGAELSNPQPHWTIRR